MRLWPTGQPADIRVTRRRRALSRPPPWLSGLYHSDPHPDRGGLTTGRSISGAADPRLLFVQVIVPDRPAVEFADGRRSAGQPTVTAVAPSSNHSPHGHSQRIVILPGQMTRQLDPSSN